VCLGGQLFVLPSCYSVPSIGWLVLEYSLLTYKLEPFLGSCRSDRNPSVGVAQVLDQERFGNEFRKPLICCKPSFRLLKPQDLDLVE